MTPIHKPGPGPGCRNGVAVGLPNGLVHSRSVHCKKKIAVMLVKFTLGVLVGFILTQQMQNLLAVTNSCIHLTLSTLKTTNQPFTLVTQQMEMEEEDHSRQLLLVGVMTADKYIETRARAVYETWGRQVPGKILFFTADGKNTTDLGLPVVRLRGVDDSYPPQKKSFMMLKYLHENYGNKFEWFMRADDDVFVKTEQLEIFLKNINSSKPFFIGQAGKGIQVSCLQSTLSTLSWSPKFLFDIMKTSPFWKLL